MTVYGKFLLFFLLGSAGCAAGTLDLGENSEDGLHERHPGSSSGSPSAPASPGGTLGKSKPANTKPGPLTLGAPLFQAFALSTPRLAVGDLDGDGRKDIAVAGGTNGLHILRSRGDGTFDHTVVSATEARSVALADIDGDGDLDIAIGLWSVGQVAVLRNGGAGTFAAPTTYLEPGNAGGNIGDVRFADVDGDGRPDLVAAAAPGRVRILTNAGGGAFTPAATSYAIGGDYTDSLTVADLDGDGHADVAAMSLYGGPVRLLKGASLSIDATASDVLPSYAYAITALDLFGSGRPNLLVATNASIRVLTSDASGHFTSVGVGAPSPTDSNDIFMSVAGGDLDLDGKLDIVATSGLTAPRVRVMSNAGGGAFDEKISVAVGDEPRGVATVDLDGDGKLDVVIVSNDGVRVLLNKTTGAPCGT